MPFMFNFKNELDNKYIEWFVVTVIIPSSIVNIVWGKGGGGGLFISSTK